MQHQLAKYFISTVFTGSLCTVAFSQQLQKPATADSIAKPWTNSVTGILGGQSSISFDSTKITLFFKQYPALNNYKIQTVDFYRKRNYAYAWYQQGLLIEQAGHLANRMLNLQSDGVYRKIPYQNTLDSLLNIKGEKQPGLTLELMLTTQYFMFAKLAWQGMNTAASEASKWYLPRKKVAYDQFLDSILKTPAKQLPLDEPVYRQYELLRNFLARYKALDAAKKWQPIVISKTLKRGDSAQTIATIKRRLFKLGDYAGDTLSQLFDDGLAEAVKQFQDRHGLTTDGIISKATIAELNVPLKNRVQQILVNMERSRWLPVFVKDDYVAVNIPEFKLHVYQADSLLWSCEVVVGKSIHQTVIFYGEIKYVVFSPYWNIPVSIVRKEVLPGIKKNRNYIASHNMEITGYSGGLPVVRQKPGPTNSLGLVKFLFPNSYNIYLHDTPSKSLFGESSRAFSHGCIRVMQPGKLAGFLLKNIKEWDAAKITAAMNLGKEKYVTLTNKVPVFIAYLTAFTDRSNRLNFRKDIYHLDTPLATIIMSGNGNYK